MKTCSSDEILVLLNNDRTFSYLQQVARMLYFKKNDGGANMPGKKRTQAEIMTEIDRKIKYHDEVIAKLEKRKLAMTTPKSNMKEVTDKIRKLGLSVEEAIALLEKKA